MKVQSSVLECLPIPKGLGGQIWARRQEGNNASFDLIGSQQQQQLLL